MGGGGGGVMTTLADAMKRAIQHQQAGNLDQAAALYRQVLAAQPQDHNARYRLAVVCQLQGRLAESIVLYEQLLQLKPDSAQVQNNLGLAYVAQNRLPEALTCCREAVRLLPNCAEFVNNLGTALSAAGAWDEAIDAHRRALALNPQYAPAWSNLGRAYMVQQQLDDAIRCFQEASALQPENGGVLYHLGTALLRQGKTVEAGDCYRQVLRLQPHNAEAHFQLATVYTAQQRWPEAAASLQNSLAYNANNVQAHAALGDIFYYHLGKYAEALRCYRLVLALSPDNARARLFVEALSGTSRQALVPPDYVFDLYNSLAAGFDQNVETRGDWSPQWLKESLEPGPGAPTLAVLDLGCGTGLCGLQFRAWAKTLIGVDLSPNMLAKARDRGVYDELILSDVLAAVQGRTDTFDLVVASDVLLFLGDLGPLFHAVQRVLRPGGRFAFTVDLLDGADDYRMSLWVHFAHSRPYLRRLMAETQLQEVSVKEVMFPREGGHSAAGLVMVLARQ